MRHVFRFLLHPISTARFDNRLSQFLCYAGSLMVLVLGILKLSRLELDEAHLFLGVLLVLTVTMLGVIGGSLNGSSDRSA